MYRMLRLIPTALILLLLSVASASQADASTPPADAAAEAPAGSEGALRTVEALHVQFLDVMKNAEASGFDGRYAQLQSICTDSFDLAFMAEKSVGRHWKKLTPAEQERWLESFHDMTAATYAGRFEGYSGQHFEIDGVEDAGRDTLLVRARVVSPDEDDVTINYRLHETGGEWKVIDVYLNGTVSELALRRSEYGTVLKREGFDELIATIEGKTREIAEASVN